MFLNVSNINSGRHLKVVILLQSTPILCITMSSGIMWFLAIIPPHPQKSIHGSDLSTKPRDWMERGYSKWPTLCWVGCSGCLQLLEISM